MYTTIYVLEIKKDMCRLAVMYIMAQCNIKLKIKVWHGTIIAQDYIVITLVEEVEVVAMPVLLLHLI